MARPPCALRAAQTRPPGGPSARRTRASWTAALALACLLAAPAHAQRSDEEEWIEIVIGALSHVRASLPMDVVSLDPGPLCTVRLTGWSCPERLHRALSSLGISLRSVEFSHVCLRGPRSCRLFGTEALFQLSDPEIEGRRANLQLDVWWRTGRRDQPVDHRRGRLYLERERGGWAVVREEGRR